MSCSQTCNCTCRYNLHWRYRLPQGAARREIWTEHQLNSEGKGTWAEWVRNTTLTRWNYDKKHKTLPHSMTKLQWESRSHHKGKKPLHDGREIWPKQLKMIKLTEKPLEQQYRIFSEHCRRPRKERNTTRTTGNVLERQKDLSRILPNYEDK